MGAYSRILLKREFEVPISADFLAKILSQKNDDDFTIRIIDKYNYMILAYTSYGTLIGGGLMADGIKVYVTFSTLGSNNTSVTIKTKLRIELYFTTIISLIFIFAAFSSQAFLIWYILPLPLLSIWFWLVYRYQENKLANDVEAFLVIQPRMGWPELK